MHTTKKIIKWIYTTSPQVWVSVIRTRLRTLSRLRRTDNEPPLAAILDDVYFARRNPLIQSRLERIQAGEEVYSVLLGFRAKSYDERAAEYPYFVDWLLEQKSGVDLLDVGCVLNNKLVSNILRARCNCVWFCNVAIEPISISNPVYCHVSSLNQAFPHGEQFPLVTCLSTIEHIGYDNSQYGQAIPAKYTTPAIEPLLSSLRKLAQLTALGGSMLISVPFGYREALIHPVTRKTASQVFDFASLEQGLAVLQEEDIASELEVLVATENGWVPTDAQTCNVRYANGCPAACAVAFIKGKKKG